MREGGGWWSEGQRGRKAPSLRGAVSGGRSDWARQRVARWRPGRRVRRGAEGEEEGLNHTLPYLQELLVYCLKHRQLMLA